ncbi:MAG: type II toxin-antitoxin system Phd/YefM family antitoxin [Burkholderiales bacterium]
MLIYNIHDAKSNFSKLIAAVEEGEEIIIAKAGKPVATLSPIKRGKPLRIRGLLKGQIRMGAEFDEPLPNDVLDAFEGKV